MGNHIIIFRCLFSILRTSLALLISLFFFWSCSPAPDQTNGITFRVNIGTEPPSIDWSIATDHVSFNVITNLMVGLTEFDTSLKPAPVVAKSWDIREDGKLIIFYLRDDVLWSDGKKVRAQDFEYSWKRLLNPQTASEYAYILFDIVNAELYNKGTITDDRLIGVRALDNLTLEVRLKKPTPYFLAITTFEVTYPQRKDIIDKYGSRWTAPEYIVINGPFLLDSWVHESEIRLKANPRFFLGRPFMDHIEMIMVSERTTALAMYERGQLDFVDNKSIPALAKRSLAKQLGFKKIPQLRGYYYGFNTQSKPFDDVRVRKAFAMAINRKVFPKILHGGELPTSSWIPPGMLAHNKKIGLTFNPAKARHLLAEAGYPGGKGFPPVTLGYNTDETHKIVAEAMQGMWKKYLGVRIYLDNQEWKVYLHKLRTNPPQIFRLGWGADYPDPNNFMKLFTSASGNNNTQWKSKRFDGLITKAANELNTRKRIQYYDEAQRILCEIEVPIIPLFVTAETTILNSRFNGLEFNSMARLMLRNVRLTQPFSPQ